MLRIGNAGDVGAKTVQAPLLDEWFGVPGTKPEVTGYAPNPVFGYSCVLSKS